MRTLTIKDSACDDDYTIEVDEHGSIDASHLKGIRVYDPAFINTAVCRSSICSVDGEAGKLLYRGYKIEDLIERCSFLEVAFTLIYGHLPDRNEYAKWHSQVMTHTFTHVRLDDLMRSFNYDAHPMGMFISSMAAMSTFHPEANPALQVDPFSATAGAAAALFGPLHGGANEAVLQMLQDIGTVENVPAFIEAVKRKDKRLMGFGHRVYKSYDPRARIVRDIMTKVFSICGTEPLLQIAMKLEEVALQDDYFVSRKLYPNVDFYTGLIYKAMGFPSDFFPLLFAIPRIVGWLAHWREMLQECNNGDMMRIWRPRQIYTGPAEQVFVPMSERSPPSPDDTSQSSDRQALYKRYFISNGHVKN